MISAWILVEMSVREVQARDRLALATEHGGSLASLQLGDPWLSRELTRLADAGVDRNDVVGVSLGSLAPGSSWLRRIPAHWWRERAGHRPDVAVAPRLLDHGPGCPAAWRVAAAKRMAGDRHRGRSDLAGLGGGVATLAPGARLSRPTVRSPGLGCLRRGAGPGDDEVLVTHTGCLLPCNQAPVLSVQPDDVWYVGVDRQLLGRSSLSTSSPVVRSRSGDCPPPDTPEAPARGLGSTDGSADARGSS